MPIRISTIFRYPVKGLSAESMDRVVLRQGECLPQDRRFAIALGSTIFDPQRPQWLSKVHFLMLMRNEQLARLQTCFDPESGLLTISKAGKVVAAERITEAEGCRSIAAFFENFLGGPVERPLRVVEAAGHAFADARPRPNATTDKYVSLINRASIAELEAKMGVGVDPIRFRANIYFDGAPAWCEKDWIGGELILGSARLRVISAITRCAATGVDPITAERDLDILAALERGFGHINMGVYAEVLTGGEVARGDQLSVAATRE